MPTSNPSTMNPTKTPNARDAEKSKNDVKKSSASNTANSTEIPAPKPGFPDVKREFTEKNPEKKPGTSNPSETRQPKTPIGTPPQEREVRRTGTQAGFEDDVDGDNKPGTTPNSRPEPRKSS